jgi:hypothetical protein
MHRIRRKLTYSNVISTLCLVLILGGGSAYAAGFGRETIGTRALKKEAVTPIKLSAASKAALTGPAGPKGATGATGAPGKAGTNGATKVIVEVGPEAFGSFAHCPSGQVAIGGGGESPAEGQIFVSEPLVGEIAATAGQTPNGWYTKAVRGGVATNTHTYVLCASP